MKGIDTDKIIRNARMLFKEGKIREALHNFQVVIKYGEVSAQICAEYSVLMWRTGNHTRYRDWARRSSILQPDLQSAYHHQHVAINLWFTAARRSAEEQNKRGWDLSIKNSGIKIGRWSIILDEKNHRPHLLLARTYFWSARDEDAAASARRCLDLDETIDEAHYLLYK